MRKYTLLFIMVLLMVLPGFVMASTDELAKQSIAKAKATSSVTPTVQMVMNKVDSGAMLIEREGKAAFDKFRGKDSEYIFAGTYIAISVPDGTLIMHPMKPKLEGKNLLAMRDPNGKLFLSMLTTVATEQGSGWVDYYWPKAGEKKPSPKVSYTKLATYKGEKFVLTSGIYDVTMAEVEAALK